LIPVYKPYHDHLEMEYLRQVVESGWWGMGPRTAEFEAKFATYIGSKHALGLNSATAALHLALMCVGVQDAEVITPSMTFVSTNHAILYNGGIPVFCDVEPENLNITTENIEQLISPRTKAIIVVHYGGYSCDMDPIMDLARAHNIAVIEDCAHACGGRYKGRMLGSIGDFGSFSFQAVKNLATGDGGMLTTNNDDWASRIKKLRWVGISKDTFDRGAGNSYDWFYDVTEAGYKYHMNDIIAAIGLAQLEKLEWMNDKRRYWSVRYREALRPLTQIQTPPLREYMFPACHNFVIKTPNRDALRAELMSKGITTGVHYYPNHLFKMYEPYYRELPVSEAIWKELVTMPLYPDLSEEDFSLIIDTVTSFFARQ
jgi:perosamine synthetase